MYALKQMQTPLWSFVVVCLLHGAVGVSKLQIRDEDACPGSTLTFECTVNGEGSTIWQGSAFCKSGCDINEIVLIHSRFKEGTSIVQCKNGAIIGQSMGVENNTSPNESLYVSQLVVIVLPEMIGTNIECIHDDIDTGLPNFKVGNISLISTPCNASHISNLNDTSHVILISKLPIAISSSVVLLFILLLLSATLIFLLYGRRKKVWSTLSSVCNTGRGTSKDCHVIDSKVDNYMEVVKIVDNEKMGIYNQSLSNYEVQKDKNSITNTEQGEISICNLNNLVYTLQGQLSSQWYSFGLAIGVPKQILNQLKCNSDEACLVEVLDYWLRHYPGKPTWQEIMEARNKLVQSV